MTEAPASALTPLSRARRLLALDRSDLVVLVMYGSVLGLLSLAVPITAQAVVGTVAFGTLLQPLIVLAVLLAAALVFGATLRALEVRVVELLQRRMFVRFAGDIAERLPRVLHEVLRRRDGRELLNRFFEVFAFQKAVASLLLGGLDAMLIAIAGLAVLAFYHPALLAFDLALLAGCALVLLLGRGGARTAITESKAKFAMLGFLESLAASPLSLRAQAAAARARQRSDELAADYLRAREVHFDVVYRQVLGALAIQVLASAGLLMLGGLLVIRGQLTLGQLVAAELIVAAVVASVAKLASKLETFYDMLASVDKLGQLLDLPLEPAMRAPSAEPEPGSGPLLSVHALTPCSDDGASLCSYTFALGAGERAVLPRDPDSRALLETLFGLRAVRSGYASIEGADSRDLTPESLRERVVLARELEAWPDRIDEHLRLVKPEAPPEALWQALRAVGLADAVRALPEGLATRLGPGGAPLLSAQLAALSLARALVADARVVLIDGLLDGMTPSARAQAIEHIRMDHRRAYLVLSDDAAQSRGLGSAPALPAPDFPALPNPEPRALPSNEGGSP